MLGQHQKIDLQIMTDLEHRRVFDDRLQQAKCIVESDLIGGEAAREQAGAFARLLVVQRHVAGFVVL